MKTVIILILLLFPSLLPAQSYLQSKDEWSPPVRVQFRGIYPSAAVPLGIGSNGTVSTGADLGGYLVLGIQKRSKQWLHHLEYYRISYGTKLKIALRPRFLYTHYLVTKDESINRNIPGGGLELFIEMKKLLWWSISGNAIKAKGTDNTGYLVSTGIGRNLVCTGAELFYISLDDFQQVGFTLRWDLGLFIFWGAC